ncbi:MAG TPA: type II secretion system protein GspC [Myxococcales bacterium]|nr:type II secretion system protein GspC [Myxococcales bacterium]
MELVLQRYSWVGTALAAVLGAYLSARIVNTVVATAIAPKPGLLQQSVGSSPQAAATPPRTELDAERLAKSFDLPLPKPATETAADVPAKPAWNAVPVRSSLRATLVGTALANPARYSLCELTNGDTNETLVYAVGDKFMGARIYAIEKDRVMLDNDGRNEYIDNSVAGGPNVGVFTPPVGLGQAQPDNSVRQLSDNQYVLAKATVNGALTDLSQLATQARIVPSFKNGVANGFKLFSIVPDSLYAKIGIQNGDVIRRINGYEMNSPDKALEIYQKLRDANRIEVEIERRGETIRKSYSIE